MCKCAGMAPLTQPPNRWPHFHSGCTFTQTCETIYPYVGGWVGEETGVCMCVPIGDTEINQHCPPCFFFSFKISWANGMA